MGNLKQFLNAGWPSGLILGHVHVHLFLVKARQINTCITVIEIAVTVNAQRTLSCSCRHETLKVAFPDDKKLILPVSCQVKLSARPFHVLS